MIHHEFFPQWGLHFVKAEKKCSLLGLVEYGVELARAPDKKLDLDLPAVFDLRAVELSNDTTESIKRAINLRKSLKKVTGGNPCAYIVGSLGSFGIMRMYGIYAELENLRKEEMTLVTHDVDEAIAWILGHLALSKAEKRHVETSLMERCAPIFRAKVKSAR